MAGGGHGGHGESSERLACKETRQADMMILAAPVKVKSCMHELLAVTADLVVRPRPD